MQNISGDQLFSNNQNQQYFNTGLNQNLYNQNIFNTQQQQVNFNTGNQFNPLQNVNQFNPLQSGIQLNNQSSQIQGNNLNLGGFQTSQINQQQFNPNNSQFQTGINLSSNNQFGIMNSNIQFQTQQNNNIDSLGFNLTKPIQNQQISYQFNNPTINNPPPPVVNNNNILDMNDLLGGLGSGLGSSVSGPSVLNNNSNNNSGMLNFATGINTNNQMNQNNFNTMQIKKQ